MFDHSRITLVLVLCTIGVVPLAAADGEGVAEAAAAIHQRHAPSVVRVAITVPLRMRIGAGADGERRTPMREVELPATVVDERGTAIFSNDVLDPLSAMRKLHFGGGQISVSIGSASGEAGKERAVEMILPDGTRLPATILHEDEALGLGVIRPADEPAEPLPHLDLDADPAAPPALLAHLVVLGRHASGLGSAARLVLRRVQSRITDPHPAHGIDGADDGLAGCPAFTLDGTLSGLLSRRSPHGSSRGEGDLWLVPRQALGELLEAAEQAQREPDEPETDPVEEDAETGF